MVRPGPHGLVPGGLLLGSGSLRPQPAVSGGDGAGPVGGQPSEGLCQFGEIASRGQSARPTCRPAKTSTQQRWRPAGHQPGPGPRARLHGHGMRERPGRAVLRREAGRCAAAARSEAAYFTALARAGLMVRLRYDPAPC